MKIKNYISGALLFGTTLFSYGQWTQIGDDIDGKNANDSFGESVSISADGAVIAIGAYGTVSHRSKLSTVRIYRKNDERVWTQVGEDIDGTEIADGTGNSISLSADGSTVAIGAPFYDRGYGKVRIYKNDNDNWVQIGDDINGEQRSWLGYSIDLSANGNIVAISSPTSYSRAPSSGHVSIYENIEGNWTKIGKNINGKTRNEELGRSISLSEDGSIVAIGAPFKDFNGSESGIVQVYKNNQGTWTKIGDDIAGDASTWDRFGSSISLSSDGSIMAIGAPDYDKNNEIRNTGLVNVYKNTSGTWIQVGNSIYGNIEEDNLGRSVSLSADGSILAIGVLGYDTENKPNIGKALIYKNIEETWTQIGEEIIGENEWDRFGYSFSLSADGSNLAIGTPFNDENGENSGHVRVYENAEILSVEEPVTVENYQISVRNDQIVVNGAKDATLELFTLTGKQVPNQNLVHGLVYIAKITQQQKVNTVKVLLQ